MTDIPIDTLLSELGFADDSLHVARGELERAGLTRSGKLRIAYAKRERAVEVLDAARFARLCQSCGGRRDIYPRELVLVSSAACSHCAGSNNDRALKEMVERCEHQASTASSSSAALEDCTATSGGPTSRSDFASSTAPLGGRRARLGATSSGPT